MHVLLIQPSQFRGGVSLLYGDIGAISQPPMGLAMLGAVLLEAGFEVDVIDIDAQRAGPAEVLAMIADRSTALVGMSVTTPVFKNAVRLADEIKAHAPDVKICLGGYHPSSAPAESVAPEAVDYVVAGEGEAAVVELARAVAAGPSPERLAAVAGLWFKDRGQTIANPARALIPDLDSLPFPARHLFQSQDYSYPDTKYSPAFPIFTSRGCPGQCAFCEQQLVTGRKLRMRSPARVADEVEHLISHYGAREVHVWDDMFTANKKRVLAIRDEFVRRGIQVAVAFTAGVRVDTVSEEVLAAMREMGGYAVAFGVESGVQEILDRGKKGTTIEEIRRAVALAKAAGFETWCFFMFGLLGETRETARRTIEFALELDPDVAKFHILKPYPGSEVHRQMKELGLIEDHDVENYGIHTYPVHRTEGLSAQEIFRFQKLAYRRFFFRPRMILRHIGRLNSWTRVKNNVGIALGLARLSFRRDG